LLLKCHLKYSLNFKPKFNNIFIILNNNKIYCKNFFFFLLFLEFFIKNINYNININFIKKKTHIQQLLRAPNRYKKAQLSLISIKYYFVISLNFLFNININNLYVFKFITIFFNTFLIFFESTLITLKLKKFIFNVPLNNLFLNYK
jgi:hypothetical protein